MKPAQYKYINIKKNYMISNNTLPVFDSKSILNIVFITVKVQKSSP